MVKRWESYIESGVFSLSVPREYPLGASDAKVHLLWLAAFRIRLLKSSLRCGMKR